MEPRRLLAPGLLFFCVLQVCAADCPAFVRGEAERIAAKSFPELTAKPLTVELFTHDSDYFQARPKRRLRVSENACVDMPPPKELEGCSPTS